MPTRDRERTRERDNYEEIIAHQRAERDRSFTGQVVIRGEDCPWVMCRQALVKHYMWPSRYSRENPETVLDDWNIFVQDIKVHSGKHRHQGGLVIYIIEGEGWSEVDGERHDWEAGDLLLLPLKPGGVEHKHYNRYDDKPAKWIAFISGALFEWGASEMVQIENHPDFKSKNSARSAR
ncbi:MAG TPA: cupin domain-containing protein [Candidatus Binatia bacterium]|nr:cupin domain-containing protein [Candidatus Binatia bacterium]